MTKFTEAMANYTRSQPTPRKVRVSFFWSFENPFDYQVSVILSTTASEALRSDGNRIGQDMKKAIAAYEEKFGPKPMTSLKKL